MVCFCLFADLPNAQKKKKTYSIPQCIVILEHKLNLFVCLLLGQAFDESAGGHEHRTMEI